MGPEILEKKIKPRNVNIFLYPSVLRYVLGAQKNPLSMSFFWAPKSNVETDGYV